MAAGRAGQAVQDVCSSAGIAAVPSAPRLPGGALASLQSRRQGHVATPPMRRLGDFPGRQLAHGFAFAICLPFRKVFLLFLP